MSGLGITTRSNLHIPFNYKDRFGEIKAKLRDFENRMGVSNSVDLSIIDFKQSPCAKLQKNRIQLPPWFLFKYDDIPLHLRVTDVNDPRLTDQNFLNEFAAWMNGKITEFGLTSLCRPDDFGRLQATIKMFRNPELFEKSKDFTLGHELAHLAHSQEGQNAKLMQAIHDTASIGGMMAGVFLLFLAVSVLPIVHVTLTVGIAAVAVAITIGGLAVWLNKPELPSSPSAIEEEKLADMDAAKMLGDAEGGIYYFENDLIHNLAIRRGAASRERNIDAHGNNLKDKDHPKLSDRVQYLRSWQAEHARSVRT